VFDGGPKTKVVMRVGGREPIQITRRAAPDSFVEQSFAGNEATGAGGDGAAARPRTRACHVA
jgi:hypothetical protein